MKSDTDGESQSVWRRMCELPTVFTKGDHSLPSEYIVDKGACSGNRDLCRRPSFRTGPPSDHWG